ncbi:glutathione S-transferase [Parasteatoda tepidariorum]|uniref:glutathione transferase n=1 Tax=Parasteatoda tepidariorum TaxID=114398 RepID=A0A2L2XX88_PARTP|nr:glutathione S-transferase [Parasteatoda tepidariorum]
MAKPVLGYLDFRVLAEPIRYLLYYKNVQFEDKRYQRDGTWDKEKSTFGFDFPSLPYYIDGKVKLTQSITILRYLAKKFDLEGTCEMERVRVALAEQQIWDFYMAFVHAVVKPGTEKREEYLKKVPDSFKLLEAFIGSHKYMVGDNLTYVDFMGYELLDFNILLSRDILDGFPILKAYHERIRNLPELQDYFNSSTYKKWPIFKPPAAWGSSGEMPQ